MAAISERLKTLQSASPSEMARLIFRKGIYRKVSMGRFGTTADQVIPVPTPCALRIEILGPDRYHEVLGTSPYLSEADISDFDRQESVCIVAYDGSRIAASTWMTRGEVQIHELHQSLTVSSSEHFSTRSYVDPDYQGQALLSHMVYFYSTTVPSTDEIWGYIFHWNAASIRSFEKLGWKWSGNSWVTFILGRQSNGSERFANRPPMEAVPTK